jgi:hypothetical protein
MNKEKIPLLIIYKQNDKIIADNPEEILNGFELYGFLMIYCEKLKEDLLNGLFENGT